MRPLNEQEQARRQYDNMVLFYRNWANEYKYDKEDFYRMYPKNPRFIIHIEDDESIDKMGTQEEIDENAPVQPRDYIPDFDLEVAEELN